MTRELHSKPGASRPAIYQIRVRGHLGCQWADWFEGLSITLEDSGTTLLSGPVRDQAALHGLLKKVRDLGVTLVSVMRVQPDTADAPDTRKQVERDSMGRSSRG